MSTTSAAPSASSAGGSGWIKLLGLLSALVFGVGFFNLRLPPDLVEMSKNWGPTFLLLIGIGAGLKYWIPKTAFSDFIAAQQGQAVALHAISLTLSEGNAKQTDKLDDIKTSLDSALINQRVMLRQLEELNGVRAAKRQEYSINAPLP